MTDTDCTLLLHDALAAPDDVARIQGADGRVALIERPPSYPGARRISFDPPSTTYRVHWSLPASSQKPDFFPPDLPFVVGIGCRVTEGEAKTVAFWRDDVCPSVDPESAQAIRTSMPTGAVEFFSAIKGSVAGGDSVATKLAELWQTYQRQATDEAMQTWLGGLTQGEALDQRFKDGFAEALRQSVDAGWEQVSSENELPVAIESATLRKRDRQRKLILTATLGLGNLILVDQHAEHSE